MVLTFAIKSVIFRTKFYIVCVKIKTLLKKSIDFPIQSGQDK